ncbi:hypothetical protein JCM33374_g2574 [Metschnikowia sp. JCM 33374]|nr:hypothetical protein JCM33374_g2574 [Metschnikowia sp. JCM 33374]
MASCPQRGSGPKTQLGPGGTLSEQQKRQFRQMRFSNKNGTSSKVDPKSYGYVSRGDDNILQTSDTAQREYFDWILETFKQVGRTESASTSNISSSSSVDSEQALASLRKLREAFLHQPPNEFSKKVHLFSVRVSSAVGHYQTYVPSIQYLLSDGCGLLTPTEQSEIASVMVLHVCHRNGHVAESLRIFNQYLDPHKDARILQTILAWASGDYHTWMSLYNSESDHSLFAVMTMGLPRIVEHMVACFDATYYTYGMSDLKKCLPKGVTWEEFRERYAVSWEVEDDTVHIRRRQPRVKSQPDASPQPNANKGEV